MESVQLVLKLEDQLSGKLKKISRDSTRLERAVIKVQNQAVRLQQKAKQMGDTLSNAFNRARKGADGLAKKLNGIRGLAVGLGAGAATKGFIEQAASFEQTQLRLELLSRQYGEFDQVQQLVRKNATTFNQSLSESSSNFADIFARLRPLGKSLSEIQTVYQGFNAVALASGTSAEAASSAFLQLSQALGSGRLQGDEFRSISEQIPGILTLVSKEMNVTVGELKELGSEGKITSDILIKSLAKGFELNKDKIQELLAESPAAKFKALKNRVDELAVSVGQQLLPAAQGATGVIEELLDIVKALPPELQTLISLGVGVGGALAAAAAGANLLGISLTTAKITAGFAAFGKFALLAGPILGVAAALEDVRRKSKEFADLMLSVEVDEIGTAIKTTEKNLKKMEGTLISIESSAYYKGQAADAAGLRDRIAEAVEQLDKLRARQKSVREVMSKTFTIAGIEYDANMVPIDPPETVSERLERLAKPPKPLSDEEKKKLKQTALQNKAASERLRISGAELKIMEEQSATDKIRLQFALKKANTEAKYADDLSKALSEQERSNLRAAERNDLEIIRLEKNEAITQALQDQFKMYDDLDTSVLTFTGHTQKLSEEFMSIADTINNEIINGINGMIDGTKTLGDVASSMLRRVANQMLETAIMGKKGSGGLAGTLLSAVGSIFGGGSSGFSFAPKMSGSFSSKPNLFDMDLGLPSLSSIPSEFKFANGGNPPVGRPSVVGERGPELFVPKTAGTIIPNHQLGTSNIVVNVDASGSSVEGDSDQASQLGKMLGAAVQAELVKQKRPGGLLSS